MDILMVTDTLIISCNLWYADIDEYKTLLTVGRFVLLYILSRVSTCTLFNLFWADHVWCMTWTGTLAFDLGSAWSNWISSSTISMGLGSDSTTVVLGSSGNERLIIKRFGGGSRSNSRTTALSRQSSAARLLICKIGYIFGNRVQKVDISHYGSTGHKIYMLSMHAYRIFFLPFLLLFKSFETITTTFKFTTLWNICTFLT